jgi:hypothetical protein
MMRLKWFLSVVVILLLAGALIWWERLPPAGEPKVETPASSPAVPTSQEAAPASSPAAAAFRKAKPVARIEALYHEESARVGSIDKDPASTEKRLREMAADLKPEEIQWLHDASLNRNGSGDGRFFATYLLALSPGAKGVEALKDIALNPVPGSKNQGLVELERGIRAQAVEGIGHSLDKAVARDALLDVVQNQKDEFLRDRAHRSIYALESGHPVEEQDKKALGKLLYGKEK